MKKLKTLNDILCSMEKYSKMEDEDKSMPLYLMTKVFSKGGTLSINEGKTMIRKLSLGINESEEVDNPIMNFDRYIEKEGWKT